MPPTIDPADPNTVLLFDLDGTITDSYDGIAGSFRHALREVGAAEPLPDVLAGVAGPPMLDTLRAIGLDAATAERAMTAYRARYTTVGWRQNAVFGGMADLITDLRASGRRLAITTSKNQTTARRILEHFALAGHFDVIVGASDDGTRRHKSHVIGFALTELGLLRRRVVRPPDHGTAEHTVSGPVTAESVDVPTSGVVMIGDRSHDVQGASAFGIPTVFVDWGYALVGGRRASGGGGVSHEGDDARWRVRSPAELRKVLGV